MRVIHNLLFAILALIVFATPANAQTIPFENYQTKLADDPAPVTAPAYTYKALVTAIYDSDTMEIWIDKGFREWRHDEKARLAGVNAYEITRKRGVTATEVKKGYQCRDLMIGWLGLDPADYPHKAKYHHLAQPSEVIIQSIKDRTGKYGRPLIIIWKDGTNLNQWLTRSGCATVTWYDGKTYDRDTPIVP